MASKRAEAVSLYSDEVNDDEPTLVYYRNPNTVRDAAPLLATSYRPAMGRVLKATHFANEASEAEDARWVPDDFELESVFGDFFEQGERLTDVADLLAFARASEGRGYVDEAVQLYGWTGELLDECPQITELEAMREEIDSSILRLRSLHIA